MEGKRDAVLLQDLLGLPGWSVEAIDDTGKILKVTLRPPPPATCQATPNQRPDDTDQGAEGREPTQPKRCQARKLVAGKKPVKENLVVRDVPIRGMPVELHVIRHRYRCPTCKGTFIWRPPEIDRTRPITCRLIEWAWERALRGSFAGVAEDVGVHKSTILRAFMAEYRRRKDQPKRRVGRPSKLSWLGIDEVYLLSIKRSQRVREERAKAATKRSGTESGNPDSGKAPQQGVTETLKDTHARKEPQCILTDVGTGRVVDLLKDREPETVRAALQRLRDQGCRLELVTMDMWPAYRDAVRKVFGPETVIVVDKFHVVEMIRSAFKEARKETEKQLRQQARQAGGSEAQKLDAVRQSIRRNHKRFLMPARLLELLEDGGNEMKEVLTEHVLLMDAREATQDLLRIYHRKTASAAANYYDVWKRSVDPKLRKYFDGVFSNFEQWGREILSYWDYRATNAYTEAANGRLKWRRRFGGGYEFETYRAFALYSVSRPRSALHESPETRRKRLAKRKARLRRYTATHVLSEAAYTNKYQFKLMRPWPSNEAQISLFW